MQILLAKWPVLRFLPRKILGESPQTAPIPRDWSEKKTLTYLRKRYQTNAEYTRIFFQHMLRHHRGNPQFDLYVNAELGSRMRSQEFMRTLCRNMKNRRLFSGKECLDIGASAGNALIAFAEGGARQAVGIEVCPQRYHTAQINIQGCPQTVRQRIQMVQGDIQTIQPASLGQFDIIFCTDVLEHVADPERAIQKICELLKPKPEAFAYVQVKNFQHPENILHEPHYDLPGMSLLPRHLAERYFHQCRGNTGLDYEVFQWISFEQGQELFLSFGKDCTYYGPINFSAPLLSQIEKGGEMAQAAFHQFRKDHSLDPSLAEEIQNHLALYLQQMRERIQQIQRAVDRSLQERFFLDYAIYDIVMLVRNKNF